MAKPSRDSDIIETNLRRITIDAMRSARETLLTNLQIDPEGELCHITVHGQKVAKEMLSCDRDAERNCRKALEPAAKKENINVEVLGEESLWDSDIVRTRKNRAYMVLLDMVDGSDLLERHFGNWCAAAVIFKPSQNRIVASVVQDSSNNLYIATSRGAFFQEARTNYTNVDGKLRCSIDFNEAKPLKGPRPPFVPLEPQKVDNRFASICFYAQKTGHFVQLPESFRSWLDEFDFQGRLYTLAGNPMMAKLANGDRVHVVFEHVGQFAHDAVPGLYIALKANASLVRLDGSKISEDDLATSLYTPSKKNALKYILASSDDLTKQIAAALARDAELSMYECPNPSHQPTVRMVAHTIRKTGHADRMRYLCGLCDQEMTLARR